MKSGNLNLMEPSGPVQACNGIDLPFFFSLASTLTIHGYFSPFFFTLAPTLTIHGHFPPFFTLASTYNPWAFFPIFYACFHSYNPWAFSPIFLRLLPLLQSMGIFSHFFMLASTLTIHGHFSPFCTLVPTLTIHGHFSPFFYTCFHSYNPWAFFPRHFTVYIVTFICLGCVRITSMVPAAVCIQFTLRSPALEMWVSNSLLSSRKLIVHLKLA